MNALPSWVEEWLKPAVILVIVAGIAKSIGRILPRLLQNTSLDQAYLAEFVRIRTRIEKENELLRNNNQELRERNIRISHDLSDADEEISRLVVQVRVLENRLDTYENPKKLLGEREESDE